MGWSLKVTGHVLLRRSYPELPAVYLDDRFILLMDEYLMIIREKLLKWTWKFERTFVPLFCTSLNWSVTKKKEQLSPDPNRRQFGWAIDVVKKWWYIFSKQKPFLCASPEFVLHIYLNKLLCFQSNLICVKALLALGHGTLKNVPLSKP